MVHVRGRGVIFWVSSFLPTENTRVVRPIQHNPRQYTGAYIWFTSRGAGIILEINLIAYLENTYLAAGDIYLLRVNLVFSKIVCH